MLLHPLAGLKREKQISNFCNIPLANFLSWCLIRGWMSLLMLQIICIYEYIPCLWDIWDARVIWVCWYLDCLQQTVEFVLFAQADFSLSGAIYPISATWQQSTAKFGLLRCLRSGKQSDTAVQHHVSYHPQFSHKGTCDLFLWYCIANKQGESLIFRQEYIHGFTRQQSSCRESVKSNCQKNHSQK